VGKVVFLPTFAAAGGQPKHAGSPTENVKIFMRTYLLSAGTNLTFFNEVGGQKNTGSPT